MPASENIASESLINKGITKEDVRKNFIRIYGDEYLLTNDTRKKRFVEVQLMA